MRILGMGGKGRKKTKADEAAAEPAIAGYVAVRRLGMRGHKGARSSHFDTEQGLRLRLSENPGKVWKGFVIIAHPNGHATLEPYK